MKIYAPYKASRDTASGAKEIWRVKYQGHDGEFKFKQFNTRREANEWRNGMLSGELNPYAEHKPKRAAEPEVIVTVEDAARAWLCAGERGFDGGPPLEASTIQSYEQHVRLHIVPRIGRRRLRDITSQDVRYFRDELLKSLSLPMAIRVLVSFKAILNFTASEGLGGLRVAPGAGVTIKRSRRVALYERSRQWERRIPTPEDAMKLLRTADLLATNPPIHPRAREMVRTAWQRYRLFVFLAFTTGMRASELRGLSWKQINWVEQTLFVCQRADRWGHVGPCKSASAFRHIPLAPTVVELLRAWKEQARPALEDNLIFATDNGSPLNLGNIYKNCWNPLHKHAGLLIEDTKKGGATTYKPKYSLHAIRHLFVSLLISSGASLKEIQTDAGHSSWQVTMDMYGHLLGDRSRKSELQNHPILGDISALISLPVPELSEENAPDEDDSIGWNATTR